MPIRLTGGRGMDGWSLLSLPAGPRAAAVPAGALHAATANDPAVLAGILVKDALFFRQPACLQIGIRFLPRHHG